MNKIIILRLAILAILALVLFMKFYLLKFFQKKFRPNDSERDMGKDFSDMELNGAILCIIALFILTFW